MAITAAMRTQVTELYVSLFGRAPERDGLAFWVGKLDAGATYAQIAQQMFDVEPARAYYPASSTKGELVAKFYSNVLGRAGDAEGVAFWTGKFDAAGKVTVGDVFAQIIAAVKGYTGTDQAALDSKALFLNKVAVGEYYGFTLNSNDVAGATTILANVTKDPASVDIAKQTNGNNPVLTSGTDKVSGVNFTSELVYTPGGDKRINSLQDEDVLTGTGTVNKLTATLGNANDNGGTVITPKLNNINVLDLTFSGSSSAGNISNNAVTDLDLQDATNVKEVAISRVTSVSNVARIENIQSRLDKMSISNSNANNTGAIEFSFGTDVLKGDTAGTLNLSNVQVGAIHIGANVSGTGATGVANTGYETLTLNSEGSSANSVGTLALPMDTGSAGKITITGKQSLMIGGTSNVVNVATSTIESVNYSGGVTQTAGRLAAIDASAFEGNLTLNMGAGLFTATKADTSGQVQNVTVTGGKGNDTFILADTIEAGDSLTGGDGTDTLIIVNGGNVTAGAAGSSAITKVEAVQVLLNNAASTVSFSKLADVTGVTVRNVSNTNVAAPANSAPQAGTSTFNLNTMSAAQAQAITVLHSDTGSNAINQTLINVGTTGTTVGLTIAEGTNTDVRFNTTVSSSASVANFTLTDADSESNTVALASAANYSGTVTIGSATGAGRVGGFINFDTTTAGANGGLNRLDVSGAAADGSGVLDLSLTAGQVKLVASTITAAAELANVTVRVSTSAAANGAQTITMGAGNDTVVFDNIQDTRAGLSISDTVAGGAGTGDTLVIDGDLTGANLGDTIALGASEWTNVSGFETIRLVGTSNNLGVAGAGNYRLTLTNELIAANNNGGVLAIINDNDTANNAGNAADTALTGVESAVVIDARSLSATSKFSYKGEEGGSSTADTIIFSDANFNGSHAINGGAVDNNTTNNSQKNADVIELRNATNASIGDFNGISNMGTIALTNDTAVTQVSQIQLNDDIVNALVDSFQGSNTTTHVERLTIRSIDNVNVAAATVGVSIDAGVLSAASALDVTLGRGGNFLQLGAGADRVVLLGNYVAGTYNTSENGVALNSQSTATAAARVVTDTINLGAGNDTLVTYGAINLVGATLSGVENITANSAVVITASQYAALVAARAALSLSTPVITFTGNVPHQLTIVDDIAGANNIDLSLIAVTSGTLVIDTTSAFTAVGVTNNTTTSNAVTVSGGATVSTGTVGTNPVNGGGTALTATALTAGGTFTSTANVNDNFTGTVATLNGTTVTGNAGDVDTITLTGSSTVAIGNGTTGGIITNIKSLVTDNTGGTITFGATTTGITTVTGGTGADNVDVTGAGTSFLAGNVNLGTGTNSLTLGAFNYTGTFSAGAGTDTLVLAAGANIAGANISGFEGLTLAATGVYTMTAAEYNSFTPASVTAGNTETIALTTAGTIVANAAIERFTLANGTNTFTAGTNTVSVVGGTGNDTFTYTATQIAGATTLDAGLGADTLNIGAIGANLNISALVTGVETLTVNGSAATGYTFTNENGAGVTLNYAKGATGDVVVLGTGGQTVNLLGTLTTAVTVTGGTGADTINLSGTATGAETITTGSVISMIDTVASFKAAGADVFKTGTAATTLNLLTIATADTSTLAAAIATAATAAGASLAANTQAYVITVAAGTAAGTYAFQNIGGTVGTVDATDFIVKITGAGSIVAGDFIA